MDFVDNREQLVEEAEPQAPEGKVLIGWMESETYIRFADYRQNVRNAIGPLADTKEARRIRIVVSPYSGNYYDTNLIPKSVTLQHIPLKKRKEKVPVERVGDLLVIDQRKLLNKFAEVLMPRNPKPTSYTA